MCGGRLITFLKREHEIQNYLPVYFTIVTISSI